MNGSSAMNSIVEGQFGCSPGLNPASYADFQASSFKLQSTPQHHENARRPRPSSGNIANSSTGHQASNLLQLLESVSELEQVWKMQESFLLLAGLPEGALEDAQEGLQGDIGGIE